MYACVCYIPRLVNIVLLLSYILYSLHVVTSFRMLLLLRSQLIDRLLNKISLHSLVGSVSLVYLYARYVYIHTCVHHITMYFVNSLLYIQYTYIRKVCTHCVHLLHHAVCIDAYTWYGYTLHMHHSFGVTQSID
jgi:hypothetical protein